jgi:lactate dehydrogenase-like 2-hydroxyacid dehydrogenase
MLKEAVMKNKIVFLDADTIGHVENLKDLSRLGNYIEYGFTLPEQRVERIADSTIIITNKVIIDREVMDACPAMRLICVAATGTNNVDLDYAAEKKILVKNVTGYSTESVAQSTISMLFHLVHKNYYFYNYVQKGEYEKSPIFTHHGREFWELKNKKFGIVGLGTIGRRVAEIAISFGCEVIYHSTSGRNIRNEYRHLSLNDLLQQADIVSIHCPLNEHTTDLISYQELTLMKSSAYLLNMGRGGIVNEASLAKALNENRIAGAATDVLTREPILSSNPLLSIKNPDKLFITPHIAWSSIEARNLLVQKIADNIRAFLSAE